MTDQGGEFSLFQGIHVRIDTEIDISISIRPVNPRFGNWELISDVLKLGRYTELGRYTLSDILSAVG